MGAKNNNELMNNVDFIIKLLLKRGHDTTFGATGGGAMFLNEAFRKEKKLNFVFTHHEQSAAMLQKHIADEKKSCNFINYFWPRRNKCNNWCNWCR